MFKKRGLILGLICCVFLFGGCSFPFQKTNKNLPYVSASLISSTETQVVIKAGEMQGSYYLIDCMCVCEASGLTFEISDGFVSEINGVKNENGYYWMLYTSDEDMQNPTFGSIEYEGETLYGAAFGAEDLEVTTGELYVWQYLSL